MHNLMSIQFAWSRLFLICKARLWRPEKSPVTGPGKGFFAPVPFWCLLTAIGGLRSRTDGLAKGMAAKPALHYYKGASLPPSVDEHDEVLVLLSASFLATW